MQREEFMSSESSALLRTYEEKTQKQYLFEAALAVLVLWQLEPETT